MSRPSSLENHYEFITDAIAAGKNNREIVDLLAFAGIQTTRQNLQIWLKRRSARIAHRLSRNPSSDLVALDQHQKEKATESPASLGAGAGAEQSKNPASLTKKEKDALLAELIEKTKKEDPYGFMTPLKK